MKKINSLHLLFKRIYQSCYWPFYSFSMTISILLLSNSAFSQTDDSLLLSKNLKKLSLEELMNIEVITASGSKQKISEAPSTMLVITAKQIEERGYVKLDDVLRDIPGVDLIHTYGQASTFITFRGMYGDENRRVLFMIDGIVENDIKGTINFAGSSYSLVNIF
ncbi:MAG: TonB-dependent receptor plug domain-containing protein [Bacteroidota bacterium]